MLRKLLLLAILFAPLTALATTIIAVRAPDFVVIATDSKATYRGRPGPPAVCKIDKSGALYFAVAGLDHDTRRNFYLKAIVAGNFSPAGNFDEQVTRVEHAVSQALLIELGRMRVEDPGTYAFTVRPGKEVASMVLAEMQKGTPHLAARGFSWTPNPAPSISISRVTCPGDCANGRELVSLGEKAAAVKFMHEISGENFDLPSLATKLVQLEIDDSPGDVGPPISEIRIDKSGATWLSNPSGCPIAAR
ncbi:MAG: hypothetical protein ACYC92_07035 [Candidatus Acidiferrales bacterium]